MNHICAYTDLHQFAVDVFESAGLSKQDAHGAADVLCYADARGHTTHGTYAMASIYAPRLRSGRIKIATTTRILKDSGAGCLMDGANRLGLLVGTEAMDLAMEKAHAYGVGIVAVRNSSHFGSAGYYTHHAAAAGLIGLAMTNCGSQAITPPLGGITKLLGTNPISAAIPTYGQIPFVLDMSTTVVATGKLRAADQSGHSIPQGWLRQPDGVMSTDPHDYYSGLAELNWLGGSVETGGAKGFGLGLLVEMLAGVLSGAAVGPNSEDGGAEQTDDNIGHMFMAIDPESFVGASKFTTAADEVLSAVADSKPALGYQSVQYPGMPEAEQLCESLTEGVSLPEYIAHALDQLALDLGVARLPHAPVASP